MKRPLFVVAVLYAAGILLARYTPPLPLPALFLAAFVLTSGAILWTKARSILLCPLIIFVGLINLEQRTATLSPSDLRARIGEQTVGGTVRGIIRPSPQRRVRQRSKSVSETTTAQIDVIAFHEDGGEWKAVTGRIVTTTRGLLPEDYFGGQTVEVEGVVAPPDGAIAEGMFDYREYLANLGIYYELRANDPTAWKIVDSPGKPPIADRFCSWARKALAMGLPTEDRTLQLEWALTLGWKAAMTEEVAEPFVRASTYHIFAVDGLRIAIITTILFTLLRVVRVPRQWCGVIAVPVICAYAALTGWPASAVRAIVMIVVVFGGWILNRPSDHLNSLYAAALIILVYEPRQLFQAGFQLSFFVVMCIIIMHPVFDNAARRILRFDPLLPDHLISGRQKWLRQCARRVLELFFASVAAWLGSIPLVAWYFHVLTPLSGLANLPAIPLCMMVLISNLTSLMFASWFPFVAELFNHAGWFFMRCIEVTSQWSANWPGAWMYVPMPPLFTTVVYYLALLAVFTGWLFQGRWRTLKITLLALLCAGVCIQWWAARPVARLTILPLGGGHGVYVRGPSSDGDLLVDCGDENATDAVLKEYLRAQGVNRLSNFALSHGAESYTGGASMLRELFRPRRIYSSAADYLSPGYREFISAAQKTPEWQAPLKTGDCLSPWKVLHPPPGERAAKAEDKSMILLGTFSNTRVLLVPNPGRPGQRVLTAGTNDLRADIVVSGLPGDGEALTDNLLDAVKPRAIVIADANFPATHRASTELRQRLARRKVPVLYAHECRAITIEIDKDHWTLRGMNGTKISVKTEPGEETQQPHSTTPKTSPPETGGN